jgi:hypothetical protein
LFTPIKTKYPLGILPYRSINYAWERALLRGTVSVPADKPDSCSLAVEAHLDRLRALDAAPETRAPDTLKPTFDNARNTSLYLGKYPSLDSIATYIETLENFYRAVLEDKGAEHRILREGRLVPTNAATCATFGDALRLARDVEVYAALRAGRDLPFEQMVGRVFRSLANTLGVNYSLATERSAADGSYLSATFTYDGIGSFRFDNDGPGTPVTLTRHTYGSNGRYNLSFQGPANLDNMQRHVFNWLIDALREIAPEQLESEFDYDSFRGNLRAAENRFYGRMNADDGFRHGAGQRVNVMRLIKK